MLSCTTRFSARLLGTARRSLAARGAAAAVHTEAKIAELGYTLPEVNPPKGAYVLCTRSGDGKTVYTAGHLPQPADGELVTGKVGADLTREEGHAAAEYAALSLLATRTIHTALTTPSWPPRTPNCSRPSGPLTNHKASY